MDRKKLLDILITAACSMAISILQNILVGHSTVPAVHADPGSAAVIASCLRYCTYLEYV